MLTLIFTWETGKHRTFIGIDFSSLTSPLLKNSFFSTTIYLVHIRYTSSKFDQNQRVEELKHLIDLTTITKLEIQPKDDISHLYFLREVLL